MAKVSVGIVGCGDIATRSYLPNLMGSQFVNVVAVCDLVPERAQVARATFGIRTVYERYEHMLQDDTVSLVVILTPIATHATMVRQAIEAGKDAYVEKPLATKFAEAQQLADKAEEKGVTLASAPSQLLHPDNQTVKTLLMKKAIGTVCFSRARSSHGGAAWSTYWTTDPSWFYKRGGGPLFDMGVYQIHLLTYFFGPVTRVSAMSRIAVPRRTIRSGPARGNTVVTEVDDCTLMTLEFTNGSYAFVDATFCMRGFKGPWVEIFGSDGTININRHDQDPTVEIYQDDHDIDVRGWRTPWQRSEVSYTLASGVEHVAQALIEKRKPLLTAEHAVHVVEVMEKAYEAARQGVTVPVTSKFDHMQTVESWHS